MALKIMHDYLKSRGQELPSPETEFEQIEYSDLHGEQVVITPEQIEALPGGSERSAAESMQMYRTQIFESAEAFFSLLGPYREAAETALFFDTLTGKLTRTSMLGKELKANNYHTPEGDLLPLSRIREYSASVPALRVLFPHNAIQNAIEEETGPWSAVA